MGSIFRDFADATLADVFPSIGHQAARRPAEDTSGFKFLQDDAVVLHEDLQLVTLSNIQSTPQFNGQHDSAELVHFSDNSRGFHSGQLPFFRFISRAGEMWLIFYTILNFAIFVNYF